MNPQSQRVVLATPSGQFMPQQIIIPSNYQTGGQFNLKRLKIIPISQAKGAYLQYQIKIYFIL